MPTCLRAAVSPHSCAPRSPRPDVGLSRALWPPRLYVGLAAVVALLFDWQLVLAIGATWTLSCFASFFLAWCTSIELVLWTSRFFCAYGVALIFRPSQWPPCGKEPAAVTYACFEQSPKAATVGSHPRCTRPLSGCLRPMLGLLGADPAAWFVLPPRPCWILPRAVPLGVCSCLLLLACALHRGCSFDPCVMLV
ncbi:hypothetical protein V6N13_090960 [Hibiscus sabdariffa]